MILVLSAPLFLYSVVSFIVIIGLIPVDFIYVLAVIAVVVLIVVVLGPVSLWCIPVLGVAVISLTTVILFVSTALVRCGLHVFLDLEPECGHFSPAGEVSVDLKA